jgi:hypothetical protein
LGEEERFDRHHHGLQPLNTNLATFRSWRYTAGRLLNLKLTSPQLALPALSYYIERELTKRYLSKSWHAMEISLNAPHHFRVSFLLIQVSPNIRRVVKRGGTLRW